MEGLSPFTEPPIISLVPASLDGPELPKGRKANKERSSGRKKKGNRVLIVGRQQELALYRAEFLRQAGFTVLVSQDVDEAIRILQSAAFDALLLSYTLPSREVQYLADAARDYCPDCVLVTILNGKAVDLRVKPDAVARAKEGPMGLVSALKRVLTR